VVIGSRKGLEQLGALLSGQPVGPGVDDVSALLVELGLLFLGLSLLLRLLGLTLLVAGV